MEITERKRSGWQDSEPRPPAHTIFSERFVPVQPSRGTRDVDLETETVSARGTDGLEPLRREFYRKTDLPRLGSALVAIGWIHFGIFVICQILYTSVTRHPAPVLGLWSLELFAVLATMRSIMGKGWRFQSTLISMVFKIWVTFLILSFNVASLNYLTGFQIEWFKLAWVTLSTFVFMMLTFLFSPWFFLGAAQMYFTGLLMIWFQPWTYGLYGLAWCVSLNSIGAVLMYRYGNQAPGNFDEA